MNKIEQQTAKKAAYKGNILNTPIRFLLETMKPHAWWGVLTVSAIIVSQIAAATMPYLIGSFVDNISGVGTRELQLEVFFKWATIFLILNLVVYTFSRIGGFSTITFLIRQNTTAMQKLFEYVTPHSHTYFTSRFAGSISNKIANAGDGSTRMAETFIQGAIRQVIIMIVVGVLLATIDALLFGVYFVIVSFTIILNIFLVKIRRPHVVSYSRASSLLRGEAVDLMTNIQATRQYTKRDSELSRIFSRVDERNKKDTRQWRIAEYIHLINNTIAFLLATVIIVITFTLLDSGKATTGSLVIAMLTMFRVSGVLIDIGDIMNRLIRFYGEVEEGLEDVYVQHEITNVPNAKKLKTSGGQINWKDVTFDFDSNRVFDEFNLHIVAGQRVGLVGPSGAGKTTFVSLLLRQHDIDSGVIEIDGQNIAEVTQDSLRQNIAVVPQEPLLFHRTIRENIAYGKPNASMKEIEEVSKKAQAYEFITALPKRFETLVGERGVKLSGGQKQRVAIARAMLKDAPILILDEATSALDSVSEVAIQSALKKLMKGKTVVAIAHRLSTLREMDRILVLENGKIVEDGTHSELSKSGGTYQRLWEHQAGGFLQD